MVNLSPEPCKNCKFLIKNINNFGHFYCRELDMKMGEFVKKCVHFKPKEKTDPKCPQCGTLLHECGTNPEKILFLCNKCGHKIKQETEPEKEESGFVLRSGLISVDHHLEILERRKKELIEAFLSKKILIPFIAKIIEKETNEEYCSSEIIAELIHDKLKEKWEGTLN